MFFREVSVRSSDPPLPRSCGSLRKDAGDYDKVHMMAEMGRIIQVVRTFIPSERWPEVQVALQFRHLGAAKKMADREARRRRSVACVRSCFRPTPLSLSLRGGGDQKRAMTAGSFA